MTAAHRVVRPTRRRRLWWLVLIVPLIVVLGFVTWALVIPAPMPEALAALQPDAQVTVTHDRWWVFAPVGPTPTTGLIFYPGGRVDPRAYAPAAHALAAKGDLVVIVPMPLNLAVLGVDRGADVIAAYPGVADWAIGGHSLGGAMAAQYAFEHPEQIAGLALWAAYPASSASLAASGVQVVSIYGTTDGLATTAKIDAARTLLPTTTRYVPIQGGNHAQFGWYGAQSGDNPATIDRSAQQAQAIAGTEALLRSISVP